MSEEMKWNESGFRPPLCTYRLNWARRTSWGWWDDWDDPVLQTQDSEYEPWRSEAEHATSRSRRLPTILTFTRGWGRNNFVSFKPPRPGTEPRTLAWKAAVLTTTLGPPPHEWRRRDGMLGWSKFWEPDAVTGILYIHKWSYTNKVGLNNLAYCVKWSVFIKYHFGHSVYAESVNSSIFSTFAFTEDGSPAWCSG